MSEGTWYRTGLVSLTTGSDLVNGVGTEFIANVLPGAIFFSPDGLYEVERAVSDTQLKLVDAYAGANSTGAEFQIAPTQGAVVQATKQLQAFLSELGPLKLAWESGDLQAKGLVLKGVKNTVEDLPAIGNTAGDGWLVDGVLYVWSGTAWSNQGSTVKSAELDALRAEAVAAKNTSQAIAQGFGDVEGAVAAAGAQATLSGERAALSSGSAAVAFTAQQAAEAARDGTLAASRLRASKAVAEADAGILVGEGYVAPLADGTLQAYRKESAVASTPIGDPFPSNTRMAKLETAVRPADPAAAVPEIVLAFADAEGNAAMTIDANGRANLQSLHTKELLADSFAPEKIVLGTTQMSGVVNDDFAYAVADEVGNIAFGVRKDGSVFPEASPAAASSGWSELSIGNDDSIVHIGDSYTASHYVLKDKAYISQLAALSPYRHINFGVSGDDALDMQYRIVRGTSTLGTTFAAAKARYAFITSLTNDSQFRVVDLSFYAENIRRLIELVRAQGAEPVVTTEFPATFAEHALLRRLADEAGCAFIDCTAYDVEVGGLKQGPFHQGHPGTRTGGVFWLPMLDFIDRMPRPTRAIKIFRRRGTFAVAAIVDLLYTGRADRNRRWKELTIGHFSLTPEGKFEELNQLGEYPAEWGYTEQADEYLRLAAGSAVPVADYALLELTLPGTASTLEAVELTLGASAAATVYVRDFLDVASSLPGKRQGAGPTDATYLSKWDKPRGAWRSLGAYATPITIAATNLRQSMTGNTLVVMLAGTFDLTALKIRYKGRESRSDLRQVVRPPAIGAELLTQPLCGTAPQLAGWVTTGAPALLVPIDLSNAPRKPGAANAPVDGVVVLTASDTIGQAVVLPTEIGSMRRFRLTVLARYFPKAFLNPALYPALDVAQIVDRIANPAAAPITPNTHDLRTLKCEVWAGTPYPVPGGAEYFDFAPLQWRPVEFVVEVPAYRAGATLSFRLSCPDGEVQVAKASFKEISV